LIYFITNPRIFDLSGREVWDSGVVSGDIIDWDRRNDTGEQLAYGAYIYSAQGWSAQGDLIFQKNGKLALMPGDKVQLQAAPVVVSSPNVRDTVALDEDTKQWNPLWNEAGNLTVQGSLGLGTETPLLTLHVLKASIGTGVSSASLTTPTSTAVFEDENGGLEFIASEVGNWGAFFTLKEVNSSTTSLVDTWGILRKTSVSSAPSSFHITYGTTRNPWVHTSYLMIDKTGRVGIGTTSPAAKLEIESSTGEDLIAAYNSSNRVFVVKSTGEVRADGAYYSGTGDCNTGGFNAGGADVAERINVSEWVEAGYVVEIDPEHPGFFRKSSSPYNTTVAGIISTSPGVILGNNFDEATDDWEDNRPVLAVTGRVPCKVSAENGPIQIGDLLVASSTPGVAMKGDSEKAMGAVVGKAMEPLQEGEGTIVVQVMLR